MTVLLDTNMLIGVINPADKWHEWSTNQFKVCKTDGPLLLIDIVLAEWSVAMKSQIELDKAISELGLQRFRGTTNALFRAGKAFLEYRTTRKGPSRRVLPDMIIGAIAECERIPLATTNPNDFRTYFPQVVLIHP